MIDNSSWKPRSFMDRYLLDFERLLKMGVDAVEISHGKNYLFIHDIFYTWDVDSIVVLNPDVIEEVGECSSE